MTNSENQEHPAKEMVANIGIFVWNFNGLDERLSTTVGLLVNPDDVARGEIVGAALMFSAKINLIKALVSHNFSPETNDEYQAFDTRLREINTVRNDLVHGEQWLDFDGVMRQRRGRITEKGYSPKHTDYTPDDVGGLADDVSDLEMDLDAFFRNQLSR